MHKIEPQDEVRLNQGARSTGRDVGFIGPAFSTALLSHPMEVFAVTIFVSLMFAVLFAALFVAERSQRRRSSIEQDALLPFDDAAPARRAEPPTLP